MTRKPAVVLAVTGSIAVYKAVYLLRELLDRGCDVWPLVTPHAAQFVAPLTFSALARRPAITNLWDSARAGEIGHVELAHRAQAVVVAPATADALCRMALGRADDPVAALCLATRAPVLVAPAMETHMWEHSATREHVRTLEARGVLVVAPEAGSLASGREGTGRLAEPELIVQAVDSVLRAQDLRGRRVLVTAGPTREHLDPARFLSNPSTGRMGFALARAARSRGAEVTLVAGPCALPTPWGVGRVDVVSTEDMLTACQAALPRVDTLVMAAAPADFRAASPSTQKMEKGASGTELALVRNPDILVTLGARERGVWTVGFAAESHDVLAKARRKLERKNLDAVVANQIGVAESGFASEHNEVTVLHRGGHVDALPRMTKYDTAHAIWDRLLESQRSAS